ncbi:MAG: MATE family efflux transporter [Ruminococcaceae bacterium]|nr:MATE family efflux transporter [Oscillospiraceae bacterium]
MKVNMQNSQIKDFTKGNITRHLIIFAWPLLLSNILQVVYSMVDMIVVGHEMGEMGISAVSVGGDVTNLLTFIGMGFASAGQILIARFIGAGQRHKIGKFVGTMSSFLFLCAVIISSLGLVFQDFMLDIMNTPEEALTEAAAYSRVCMIGLVFIYGYNVVSAILRGMGDSKHPLIFIGVSTVINIVLDIILVKDHGAFGAAIATVISQAVSFISCTIFLVIKRREFELNTKINDFIKWDKNMLKAFVSLGSPMAIKFASVQVSKLFVNAFINDYGVAVSAFSGIANKLASVVNLFSNAFNTAGSTMVGQNLVAGKFDRVRRIMRDVLFITLAIVIIFSTVIVISPEKIFGLFADETSADALRLSGEYVPIALMMFLASSLRAVMNALINGSGHTMINFATAILDGIVLRIGLAVLLGLVFDMGYFGFWLGDAIAGFTPFWIGIIFYFSGKWKKCTAKAEK